MSTPISVLCILFDLFITGFPLKCMICVGPTNLENCQGLPQSCPDIDDVCLTLVVEYTVANENFNSFMFKRSCGRSYECDLKGTMTNSHQKQRFVTTCCDREECEPSIPELPQFSNEMNGLMCSFYTTSYNDPHPDPMVKECTGNEIYCINHCQPYISMDMNGCAAESFCRVKDILKSNSLKKESFMCTKPIGNTHVCRTSTEWKENKIYRYLCMPDEDVCLSEYTQSIYDNGTVISEHILRCGKSSECNLHITITHPKKTIGIRTTCCSTYDCIPPTVHASFVKVPQPEYNGLTCQACYSDGSINCVSNNTMVCTGTQDHCIIYTSEKKHSPDPYSKKYVNSVESLTGCGTKDSCIYGRSFVTFDHHGKTVNITCTKGSSNINFLSYLSWTFFTLILLQYVNTLL